MGKFEGKVAIVTGAARGMGVAEASLGQLAMYAHLDVRQEDSVAAMTRKISVQRLGRPDEMAGVVVFLASDDSS